MSHQRRKLLDRLLLVARVDDEKNCSWELLTDCLEIVAVAEGLKPSHLQGHGMRSQPITDGLRGVATLHHLETLETRPLAISRPRPGRQDFEILMTRHEREVATSNDESVLWIFKNPELPVAIRRATETPGGVAAVLGYPACCIMEYDERLLDAEEEFMRRLREEHGAASREDFERLIEADVVVQCDALDADMGQALATRVVFPFVQFTACQACTRSCHSEAARMNSQMKSLAMRLGRGFHDAIEEAALEFEREE